MICYLISWLVVETWSFLELLLIIVENHLNSSHISSLSLSIYQSVSLSLHFGLKFWVFSQNLSSTQLLWICIIDWIYVEQTIIWRREKKREKEKRWNSYEICYMKVTKQVCSASDELTLTTCKLGRFPFRLFLSLQLRSRSLILVFVLFRILVRVSSLELPF